MHSVLHAPFSALKNFDILEETLSDGRKYLVNNEFSVADISVGYAGQTLKMLGVSGTSKLATDTAQPCFCIVWLVSFLPSSAAAPLHMMWRRLDMKR
jgi:glutathione S-transferase